MLESDQFISRLSSAPNAFPQPVYLEVLRSLGSEIEHVCLNGKKMRGLCVKGFFELYPNWGRVMPHLVLRKVQGVQGVVGRG